MVGTNGKVKSHIKTLYSNPESSGYRTYNFDAVEDSGQGSDAGRRFKRDSLPDTVDPSTKVILLLF